MTITVAGQQFLYSYTVNDYVIGIELVPPTVLEGVMNNTFFIYRILVF